MTLLFIALALDPHIRVLAANKKDVTCEVAVTDQVPVRERPEDDAPVVVHVFAAEGVDIFGGAPGWKRVERGWINADSVRKPETALREMTELIRTAPSALAYACRSRALSILGRSDEALADASRSIEINGEYPPAWYCRASARRIKGDMDGAEQDSRRAIALAPTFGAAQRGLGFALLSLRRAAEARDAFDSAIAHCEETSSLLAARGVCHWLLAEPRRAVDDLTRAIELRNDVPEWYENRAAAYITLRQDAKGMNDLERALELRPSALALSNRAVVLQRQGRSAEALRDLERAIELDPRSAHALTGRADQRLKSGDMDGAMEDATRALKINPACSDAIGVRAVVLIRRGEYSAAYEALTKGTAESPHSANLYCIRAELRACVGDYPGALSDFAESLRLDPLSDLTLASKAWLLATCPDPKIRDAKQALDAASRACELTKLAKGRNVETLAAAHAECGNFDLAIRHVTTAMKLAPGDAHLQKRAKAALDKYERREAFRDQSLRTLYGF